MCMRTVLWVFTRFHGIWFGRRTPMPGYNYHYQRWSILISNTLCSYALTTPSGTFPAHPTNTDRFNRNSQSWNGICRMPNRLILFDFKSRDDTRLLLNKSFLMDTNERQLWVCIVQSNAISSNYCRQTDIYTRRLLSISNIRYQSGKRFHSVNC